MDKKIAIVDIETTGFHSVHDKIVEIGIVELDLENGAVTDLFDAVIKEKGFTKQKHADAWVFKNSDLKFEDVKVAKLLKNYYGEIQSIFNRYKATAFNKAFDFKFLKRRQFKITELDCIMVAATDVLQLPPRVPGTLYKWPNVSEAWSYFFNDNNFYTEKHRALDDARHEAKIAYELYKIKAIFN